MWLQIIISICSNFFPDGIKMTVPVTEMKMARCGLRTSKYYLEDFEASNRQFIREKDRSVLHCDRVPLSRVA